MAAPKQIMFQFADEGTRLWDLHLRDICVFAHREDGAEHVFLRLQLR